MHPWHCTSPLEYPCRLGKRLDRYFNLMHVPCAVRMLSGIYREITGSVLSDPDQRANSHTTSARTQSCKVANCPTSNVRKVKTGIILVSALSVSPNSEQIQKRLGVCRRMVLRPRNRIEPPLTLHITMPSRPTHHHCASPL